MKSPRQKCFGFFLLQSCSCDEPEYFNEYTTVLRTGAAVDNQPATGCLYSLKYNARSHPQEIHCKNKTKINL